MGASADQSYPATPRSAADDRSPLVDGPSVGVWCIVVAGGSGRRFGGPKQFESLAGRRVLDRSVAVAATAAEGVVVVLPQETVADHLELAGATAVVAGGSTRAGSVRSGLAAVPAEAEVVLVHDAARPLATEQLFCRVRDAVRAGAEAVVPAVPVTDTIRRTDGGVVDRDELRAVQTPQGFAAQTLRRVHRSEPEATDDAGLVEREGGTVTLVVGERSNLKITDPDDMVIARAILSASWTGPELQPEPAPGSEWRSGSDRSAAVADDRCAGGDSSP